MIGLGAFLIDTSNRSPDETNRIIIAEINRRRTAKSR